MSERKVVRRTQIPVTGFQVACQGISVQASLSTQNTATVEPSLAEAPNRGEAPRGVPHHFGSCAPGQAIAESRTFKARDWHMATPHDGGVG